MPIRKQEKECTNPGNYRPIALTSNICKIMEKMINERLTYYMENMYPNTIVDLGEVGILWIQ